MTGEKKSSDLSARLKRPLNKTARSSKAPSPSRAISAPPKAALAPSKAKKEESHRRKTPFNEMLLQQSGNEASSSSTSVQDEQEHEQHGESQHTRNTSIESIKSITDVGVADRVGALERALVVALEEQNALRDELEKVRQHGVVYRETIEDYRRQLNDAYTQNPHHSRSGSPFEREVEHRRSPNKQQQEDLVQQNYELRSKFAELQEQFLAQEATYRGRMEQQLTARDAEWSDLTIRLHHSEKESQERLKQLLDLKHSISALTRMESQMTDSEVVERVDQLYHRVREWAVSNFRRTKLDLRNMSKDTAKALELVLPDPGAVDSTDRLAFYQSVVSSHLMQLFSESIYIGLPESGSLASIRHTAAVFQDTGAEYREWRRTTIRALERSHAKQQLQIEREKLLHRLAEKIQAVLFDLTSVNLSPTAHSSLLGILQTAAELQHTFLLQKAQYKVHFFRTADGRGDQFDEEQMENVNDGMDDDILREKKLVFCVFPCLNKSGDEVGENLQVRNTLLKARVCCGVG